jgi:hypothetical protein
VAIFSLIQDRAGSRLEFICHDPRNYYLISFKIMKPTNKLALAAAIVSFVGNANAAVLFQDNFTGNSLNSSNWTQHNTYAWGPSSLTVNNGTTTLNYRPIITTKQVFSSPINITGSFSLGNQAQNESLLFVTRSDGSRKGGSQEPEGLRFRFNNSGVDLQFLDAQGGWTAVAGPQSLSLNNNQTYSFSIIDAGNQASISIDGVSVLSTSVDPTLGGGQGFFAIANRERAAGTQVGPITISSISPVPEPSAMALLGLGAMGLFARRRRN